MMGGTPWRTVTTPPNPHTYTHACAQCMADPVLERNCPHGSLRQIRSALDKCKSHRAVNYPNAVAIGTPYKKEKTNGKMLENAVH